jgi:hypothetical protein
MPLGTPGRADVMAVEEEKRRKAGERTAERLQAFKDAHGGMNAQQYGRQQRRDRRETARFRRDVMRGMNPMSPQALALHPKAAAEFRKTMGASGSSMQNPMLDAFKPDAPNTPENEQLRGEVRAGIVQTPTMQAIGATTDMGPLDFARTLAGYEGDISDEGLKDILTMVKTYGKTDEGASPFPADTWGSSRSEQLNDLWKMPQNASPKDIRKWYEEWRSAIKRRSQEVLRPSAGAFEAGPVPMM